MYRIRQILAFISHWFRVRHFHLMITIITILKIIKNFKFTSSKCLTFMIKKKKKIKDMVFKKEFCIRVHNKTNIPNIICTYIYQI